MEKIPILLVDDQRLFVDNLKIVLESRTKDLRVVAIAYNGRDAVDMTETLHPSLILMDVRMPVMDGVEATRLILRRHPEVRIVMLTTFDDDDYVHQALHHGASGYILKSISPSELISSIRAVLDGVVLISPAVANKLLQREKQAGDRHSPKGLSEELEDMKRTVAGLTQREREIVELIALAYDNKQIAERLNIAEQTVKNIITTIFLKIGIGKRTQLMRFYEDCKKNGLFYESEY